MSESAMLGAMNARKGYIKQHVETLTAKKVRRLLEEDLGLELGALDRLKEQIKRALDVILVDELASAAEPDKKKPVSASVKKAAPTKPKPQRPADGGSKKQGAKHAKEAAQASTGAAHSAAVQKMKRICKDAGIGVGPNMYKRPDVDAAFRELLAKHGLTVKSDPAEIAEVRRVIEEKKDMEGIDTCNIVEGGRRGRRVQPSYAAMCSPSESDAEGSGSEGGDDSGSDPDGRENARDAKNGADAATKRSKARGGRAAGCAASQREEMGASVEAGATGTGGQAGTALIRARAASPDASQDAGTTKKRQKVDLNEESDDEEGEEAPRSTDAGKGSRAVNDRGGRGGADAIGEATSDDDFNG